MSHTADQTSEWLWCLRLCGYEPPSHSRIYARATGARAQGGKFPGAAY